MGAICATSHKGRNTKNEAVLLFVAEVCSDFSLILHKTKTVTSSKQRYLSPEVHSIIAQKPRL